MKLRKVTISHERLSKIPSADRNALLLFGHVINELNVLQKAAIASINSIPDDPELSHAGAGQATLFVRMLGGKTFEAWEAFRMRFLSDPILGPKYGARLRGTIGELWRKLNTKFSTENRLALLRNDHAFHYPDNTEIEAAFAEMSSPEGWSWYLSDTRANTYMHASDVVAMAASFRIYGPTDITAAVQKFADDVIDTAGEVATVLDAVVAEILLEHFADEGDKGVELDLTGSPREQDIRLPFYWAVGPGA